MVITLRRLNFNGASSILHLIKYIVYITIGRPISGNTTVSPLCIVFKYLYVLSNKEMHNKIIGVKLKVFLVLKKKKIK